MLFAGPLISICARSQSYFKGARIVPKTKLVTCGDHAWVKAAPLLRNVLPANIRNSENVDVMKARLKPHLFE